jgi:hypothetical protein
LVKFASPTSYASAAVEEVTDEDGIADTDDE